MIATMIVRMIVRMTFRIIVRIISLWYQTYNMDVTYRDEI